MTCKYCNDDNIWSCSVSYEDPQVSDCPGCEWDCCGFCRADMRRRKPSQKHLVPTSMWSGIAKGKLKTKSKL